MPSHRGLAVGQLADVALDEVELGPLPWGDQSLDFIEVALVAGGEIVEADHALVEFEQGFEQVATNEASHTGNEPGFCGLAQFGLDLFVAGHVNRGLGSVNGF